jgi:dihydroorotate dehydrogenase (fumarate)/dihydroorotate dehydrogenase
VYRLIRPLVFCLDPEQAHTLALRASGVLGGLAFARSAALHRWGAPIDRRLATNVAGVAFPNPVGLGAGYDKSADAIPLLSRMGFGFLEIGSVSRWPSAGNPVRPRAFRLPADEAVIVNYGVPNDGADVVLTRVRNADSAVPVGVNLVETNTGREASTEAVIEELAQAAAMFAPVASFLAISAECANAPGIHPIAQLENLRKLLDAIGATGPLPPVFVKLRVPEGRIEDVLRITDGFPFVRGFRINTISPRPYVGLATPRSTWEQMKGSLSSPALGFPAMLDAVRTWYVRADPKRYALIASGGIRTGHDAYLALRAGASLVQCVTALVFAGPSLARRINRELLAILEADGIGNVSDIVGNASISEYQRQEAR